MVCALTLWVVSLVDDRDTNFGGSGAWYTSPLSKCLGTDLIQKGGTRGLLNVDRGDSTSAGVNVQDKNARASITVMLLQRREIGSRCIQKDPFGTLVERNSDWGCEGRFGRARVMVVTCNQHVSLSSIDRDNEVSMVISRRFGEAPRLLGWPLISANHVPGLNASSSHSMPSGIDDVAMYCLTLCSGTNQREYASDHNINAAGYHLTRQR